MSVLHPLQAWRPLAANAGAGGPAPASPLERLEILRTVDPGEAMDVVGRVIMPHRLDVISGRGCNLLVRLCSYRGRDLSVNLLSYGTDVRVVAASPRRHYTVFVPLAGKADIRVAGQRVQLHPGVAAVVSPREPMGMRWNPDCEQAVLRIDQTALEACLTELLGAPLSAPLRFLPRIDLSSGHGLSWFRILALMIEELDAPGVLMATPSKAERFERLLLTSLLEGQQHSYSEALRRSAEEGGQAQGPHCPEYVREVRRMIEDHPEWEHTTSSLAEHVSYSVRGLQKGFSRHMGTSPSDYLRQVRLRRVRDALVAARADVTTVEAVARRWGFRHYGHFAGLYRKEFGESPRDTLRR